MNNTLPARLFAVLFLIALGIPLVACSATERQQTQVFEALWRIVDERYVDPEFNGVDWAATRARYRAQIAGGLSDEEFWRAMNDMVSQLEDDHTVFLSPDETADRDRLRTNQFGYVGIGIFFHALPAQGHGVVLLPFAGGPAAEAGIRTHDRVLLVDGQPFCCDDSGAAHVDRVLGPKGTEVVLTIQTPGDDPRELSLTRSPVEAEFPVIARRLENDLGYIMIPTLQVTGIAAQVETAWLDLLASGPVDGLVLDLRTNRGGLEQELTRTLALFESGAHGHFVSRAATRPLEVSGRDVAGSQEIDLVVLVSDITESFAEVLAGVLQESGRAILIGYTTAGNIEAAHRHDFDDGSSALIAQETFVPASGADWETVGVAPDLEINLRWDEFSGDADDQVLQAAKAWLATAAEGD